METMAYFIFLGSRSTAGGDWSHEIKRVLLLGKKDRDSKPMTNLDSIFKSRDISLLTKICKVKPMIFPVIIYGCEKAECQIIDTF